MLDEKKIKEVKLRIEQLVKKGDIIKEKEGKFIEFFLDNSKNSFNSAKLLLEVSSNSKLKDSLGYPDFNCLLWVINASYYSMFYMARALLENNGIKIKVDLSIHSLVFDSLTYYFYITGKLEKKFIEEFKEAELESYELLGKDKAKEIMEDYLNEKDKRGKFTYEMGEIVMIVKAKTSINRARRFNEEIRKLIE
ncbi:MAG TPA: hypothetical protein VJB89_01200 [Candidatus Nanoarchaeia archaeon]|nr:hypothetical protein [Candidatus Nanoarchaeia archaeon]